MPVLRPEFNESQFEFACNHELVTSLGGFIAGYLPDLPTRRSERDLGWDSRIRMPTVGTVMLLQYKTSVRVTARASRNTAHWDLFADQYWRFTLHKDRRLGNFRQHETLRLSGGRYVEALYCAPRFLGLAQLSSHVACSEVLDHSELINAASLGPAPVPGPHHVAFPVNPSLGPPTLFSDPQPGHRTTVAQLQDAAQPIDRDTFHEISAVLAEAIDPELASISQRLRGQNQSTAGAFLEASFAAKHILNATLAVLPPNPRPREQARR